LKKHPFILIILCLALPLALTYSDPSEKPALLFELDPTWIAPDKLPSDAWRQALMPQRDAVSDQVKIEHLRIPTETQQHPLLRGIYRLELPSGSNLSDWKGKLEATPGVKWAEEPPVRYTDALPEPKRDAPPDDPYYPLQWSLHRINAAAGWDITRGDTNVVIALVDVGTDFTHSDLVSQRWMNWAEVNGAPGVDDDDNGFIDDRYGWDFKDDDNNPSPSGSDSHGSHIAGIAGAATDNGFGIAGVAWHCRLMGIRAGIGITITRGYEGIVYAAAAGADAISLSWGSSSPSNVERITAEYAMSEGALVVAAAGNLSGAEQPQKHYPASYEDVLAVAAVADGDILAVFSNYGSWVDICAPGQTILSTVLHNGFGLASGTSMATPMVAGAAALVKALHPDWTPRQIALQLTQTTDPIDDVNPSFAGSIGSGRLNLFRALNDSRGGFELLTWEIDDAANGDNDDLIDPSEHFDLSVMIRNELTQPIELTGLLTTSSDYVRIDQRTANFGVIPPGVTASNSASPFLLHTLGGARPRQELPCLLELSGSGMANQLLPITLLVQQQYDDHDNGNVTLTVTNFGALGYYDYIREEGLGEGFRFPRDGLSGLFHGSLMVGVAPDRVSDCAYGDEPRSRFDFAALADGFRLQEQPDGAMQGTADFNDEPAEKPLGVQVRQTSVSYPQSPDDDYVILSYEITVPDTIPDTLFVGLYLDWDIVEASRNVARWNAEAGAGWMEYERSGFPVFGAALLSDLPDFQVAVNNSLVGSWDDAGKISQMQTGLVNPAASEPDDYSQLVGAIYTSHDITATFVLAAGENADDLLANVAAARTHWNGRLFGNNPPSTPQGIELIAAYPSPFNESFAVLCRTDAAGWVIWRLYDLSGRMLPVGGELFAPAGHIQLPIRTPGMPSGQYLLQIQQDDHLLAIPATLTR
jgi:hypothetical protein